MRSVVLAVFAVPAPTYYNCARLCHHPLYREELMAIGRREFIRTTSALAAGVAAQPVLRGQEGGTAAKTPPIPTRQARVERLFKAPDLHPNALETAPDGLWIGDQVSERVFKVDWQTGKVLHEVQTESHNTSGLAVGGGFLWLGANGGVSGRRPARPQDKPFGEIVQADIKTGKTIKVYRPPWLTGIHGITWVDETQTLWATALSINALAELDPKDNLRNVRLIPDEGDRPHALACDNGNIRCLIARDPVIQTPAPESGKIPESGTRRATPATKTYAICMPRGSTPCR